MPTLSPFNTNGLHINMYLNDSLISVNNFISMIENKMFLHKHYMKNQNMGALLQYLTKRFTVQKNRYCNTKIKTIYS